MSESQLFTRLWRRRARITLAGRRSVNYREADADYPTRLIGGSNGDSEVFTAIYRRPRLPVLSSALFKRPPLVKPPEIATGARARGPRHWESSALIRHARDSLGGNFSSRRIIIRRQSARELRIFLPFVRLRASGFHSSRLSLASRSVAQVPKLGIHFAVF